MVICVKSLCSQGDVTAVDFTDNRLTFHLAAVRMLAISCTHQTQIGILVPFA